MNKIKKIINFAKLFNEKVEKNSNTVTSLLVKRDINSKTTTFCIHIVYCSSKTTIILVYNVHMQVCEFRQQE